MKKKDIIARYSELANNRNEIASASANALTELVTDLRMDLPTSELAALHADIATVAAWDQENDQREIANLIAVANSDSFDMDYRREAARRVATMLELDE